MLCTRKPISGMVPQAHAVLVLVVLRRHAADAVRRGAQPRRVHHQALGHAHQQPRHLEDVVLVHDALLIARPSGDGDLRRRRRARRARVGGALVATVTGAIIAAAAARCADVVGEPEAGAGRDVAVPGS